MSDIVPLRDVPVSTDGVEVRGIIYSLYPNDVSVIMTAPVGGLRRMTTRGTECTRRFRTRTG